MPQDRLAQMAAERSFVELKDDFLKALNTLSNAGAAPLAHQVSAAREPGDLLALRVPVLQALRREARQTEETRLHIQLGQMFEGSRPPRHR